MVTRPTIRLAILSWVTGEENKRHARDVLKVQIGRKRTRPKGPENRPTWPIDIDYPGYAVHWDVRPDPRNVRAWVVVDRQSGAVVMRGGMDRIATAVFSGLPRGFLGRRAAGH